MGSNFKALGFFEKFTALGWEAVLSFKGHSNGDVYVKSIMEWMSTLTKDDGNDPPKTITLSGKVNNKTVTLSPATMRSLAKFDSKADSFYQIVKPTDYFSHPEKLVANNVMNTELFVLNKEVEMKRDNSRWRMFHLVEVKWMTKTRVMRRKREAGEIVGTGSSAQVEEPRQTAHSWGVFDDEMQARVESMRPPEYVTWELFQQSLYDQGSRLGVVRERQHNELMAHQRAVHIGNEMNLNLWAYDENQTRRHNDYCLGAPFVQNPSYVDYSQLPPFQPGMVRPPTSQVHGSMWLPRVYLEPHFQSSYPFRPPPYQYPS
ncbi:hypothetical protein HanRHA438_Chr16g0750071 [Helianthus annuus]|uniref:Uncharacterized protein n=1 Tax=Helianthus annuus TaxID=4232 RepID=A0A9K3DQB0_HELAN|nr:hypothetical protein HanXRQr2_Chr16g0737871 [Helianthus annuus]KAJ0437391.1 hypothetical protein HanHA300_Chr16g0601621 [Helianthus annuus]KAJ0441813.1 hypothetical protein HanIR_Chr16g0802081 [Helianthus annuus]KAJ0459709.1 hypothetical protein HanHA89_Chr16g0652141 [Helianthus annuus]KAJ0644143.1 hypothetical protein HanOQP8_Chr16g0608631 [Helianthus annuus]